MGAGREDVLETELAVGGGIGVPRGNGLEEVPQPRPGREVWCQRHGGVLCRGGVEKALLVVRVSSSTSSELSRS